VTDVAPNAPPSDYAIADLVNGVPGAAGRVVGLTLLRCLLIGPGLYLTGMRGKQLVTSTLAASASVTAGMTAWYVVRRPRT